MADKILIKRERGDKDDISIVLSCPGKAEKNANPRGPAKGQTGKNMEDLFWYMRNSHKRDEFVRSDCTIANAWPYVEYRETGRSEATIQEVLEKDNLDGLYRAIGHTTRYIICAGGRAEAAVRQLESDGRLNKPVKIVTVRHLGLVSQNGQNGITEDIRGNEIKVYRRARDKPESEMRSLKKIAAENRLLRIEFIAQELNDRL